MTRLIRLEFLKLRTTPALFVIAAVALGLSLVSAVANILTAGHNGTADIGTVANVQHVLNQPSAVVSMTMFVLGILVIAGEYRQRTIIGTFLAEPRRVRVVLAKLFTTGVIGALVAAVTYALTVAVAMPVFALKGVHHLSVNIGAMGLGTVLIGSAFALLGVAVGALTRNTVAAIIAGLVWIQIIEVAILENAIPSLARWLPAGAAQALTNLDHSTQLLSPGAGAAVLVGWAAVIVAAATKLSVRRELH
jgi:ABC-2 type transport system permease protein